VQVEGSKGAEPGVLGAVEVGRTGAQQPALSARVGEQQRLLAGERDVEGLDTVEALSRKAVDCVEDLAGIGEVPERMRPHREAVGSVNGRDRIRDRRARTTAVGRRALDQFGDEQFGGVRQSLRAQPLGVVGMSEDRGGEVGAPNAATARASLLQRPLVDRPASLPQRVGHPPHTRVPVRARRGKHAEPLGVTLIIRGPNGFYGGHVSDALVSHLDLYPTLLELAGARLPTGINGHSMLPLVRKEQTQIRAELFAELTYHAAYDPQRAIRTHRYKLIRHFGDRLEPVLPNVDDSPSKDLLIRAGWGQHPRPRLEFYDLVLDPGEMRNLADDAAQADVLATLDDRLHGWMRETADPLLRGPISPPPGARVNDPAGVSAREPTVGEID
jgi:hypothetical protein